MTDYSLSVLLHRWGTRGGDAEVEGPEIRHLIFETLAGALLTLLSAVSVERSRRFTETGGGNGGAPRGPSSSSSELGGKSFQNASDRVLQLPH
jgi:hypothetical protein